MFKHVTIKTKALVLSGLFVLSVGLVVLIGSQALAALKASLNETAAVALPRLAQIASTERALTVAQVEFSRALSWANSNVPSDVLTNQITRAAEKRALIEEFLASHAAGEDIPIVKDIADVVQTYVASNSGALDMLTIDVFSGTMLANETDQLYDVMIEAAALAQATELAAIDGKAEQSVTNAAAASKTFLALASFFTFIGVVFLAVIVRSILLGLSQTTYAMKELASGNLDIEITGADARNEIGAMASALEVFRDTALETKSLRVAEEKSRVERVEAEKAAQAVKAAEAARAAEQERAEHERGQVRAAQSARLEAALSKAISSAKDGDFSVRIEDSFDDGTMQETCDGVNELLASTQSSIDVACSVLRELANGNLQARMTGAFHGAFEDLQASANVTAQQFEDAICRMMESASGINDNAQEISMAAEDLARRTESSAASLEETAAAIVELTASVTSTASNTEEVDVLLAKARKNAAESATITAQAGDAMDEISDFSNQIAKATDMINDIAFQTNLLALNAGVEAARAGDSGRGFAVVASEVRSLAQGAEAAAKQIGVLILKSTSRVSAGVDLVTKMRELLSQIGNDVTNIATNVTDISTGIRDQASGLSEVSVAISQIDSTTQQNAAMFEETTAATQALAAEVGQLTELAGRYNTGMSATASAIVPNQTDTLPTRYAS